MNALTLIKKWLEQEGHEIEIHQTHGYAQNIGRLSTRALYQSDIGPTTVQDISIIKCRNRDECVEVWVGGNHNTTISLTGIKLASKIAWRINLYDPKSLPRISEILWDGPEPTAKSGDYLIKNRHGRPGKQ
jgi:hypothetical protein